MLESIIGTSLTFGSFFACTGAAVVLGILSALVFTYGNRHTSSFALTLALLPATVQLVIMMVNGNIGAGVAVAGAFSLVRFRSAPGTAREIAAIFVALSLGLACGMGYLGVAALFFIVMAAVTLLLTRLDFGGEKGAEKELKITIPENLDYEGLFDDLFDKYGVSAELDRVKTTNMGTLYELSYRIRLAEGEVRKDFLDELRCRNGNLNIVCGRRPTRSEAL